MTAQSDEGALSVRVPVTVPKYYQCLYCGFSNRTEPCEHFRKVEERPLGRMARLRKRLARIIGGAP